VYLENFEYLNELASLQASQIDVAEAYRFGGVVAFRRFIDRDLYVIQAAFLVFELALEI